MKLQEKKINGGEGGCQYVLKISNTQNFTVLGILVGLSTDISNSKSYTDSYTSIK